jgi:glycosyltransferase involved in cell wall biosynthesis
MIVKNEEANLPACLESGAGLVAEIIVIDTGSSDRTREVAASLGARVVNFPWQDSFSDARNESIRHATGEWVLWLDADDRIDAANRQKLEAVLSSLHDADVAVNMRTRLHWGSGRTQVVDHVRLFRRRVDICWKYRVHEQLMIGTELLANRARSAEVVFDHLGYNDAAQQKRKEERNLALLELDHRDNPDDPSVLFFLGWTRLRLGDAGGAITALEASLQRAPPTRSYLRPLYSLLARACDMLGERDKALATCREGRRRFPNDVDLMNLELYLQGRIDVRGW